MQGNYAKLSGFILQEIYFNDYRFRDQINGSSGSIMDNIAEGFERDGKKELFQFLSIGKGSCGELRSQGYRAFDAKYITKDELDDLLSRTGKLGTKIWNLMNYLKNNSMTGKKYK